MGVVGVVVGVVEGVVVVVEVKVGEEEEEEEEEATSCMVELVRRSCSTPFGVIVGISPDIESDVRDVEHRGSDRAGTGKTES